MVHMAVQRNDKDIDRKVKEILLQLSERDTSGGDLKNFVKAILSWYKNKERISSSSYYSSLESEQVGRGSGAFYKHMSLFFEIYMEILQSEQKHISTAKE